MKKKEGFKGQESIVVPELIRNEMRQNPMTNLLHVTDIGFYPKARHHYRERPDGCSEHVLIYCMDGNGWIEVDQKRFNIHRNMYLIIPRGIPHQYGATDRDPWSIYWLHFAGEKADLFVDRVIRPREIEADTMVRHSDRMLIFSEIYENLSHGFTIENLEYSSICLWHMLGSFRYLSQFLIARKTKQPDLIGASIDFMHKNINVSLSLEELAKETNLSTSHYCLLFRKKTGQTPLGFFTYLRIQHACRLLDFSDLKIKQIAEELGFDDPYYFSRVFKKIMRLSPQVYRKIRQ